jgi:hypothetical protein
MNAGEVDGPSLYMPECIVAVTRMQAARPARKRRVRGASASHFARHQRRDTLIESRTQASPGGWRRMPAEHRLRSHSLHGVEIASPACRIPCHLRTALLGVGSMAYLTGTGPYDRIIPTDY